MLNDTVVFIFLSLPPEQMDPSVLHSSGDVVSAELVCFRDVSELQKQNQKLLATIR